MIKEISGLQAANNSTFATSKKIKNSSVSSMMTQEPEHVLPYSLNNLRANYISFTGERARQITEKIDQSTADGGIGFFNAREFAAAYKAQDLMTTNERDLYSGSYYSSVADDVVVAMGSKKNILMPIDEQVRPELLIHNLVKKVKEGNYRNLGLMAHNTHIYDIDPIDMGTDAQQDIRASILAVMEKESKSKINDEHIFFIRDFGDFLNAYGKAKDLHNIFDRESFSVLAPNVRIVGVLPKAELKLKTPDEIIRGDMPKFNPDKLKFVRRVEVKGLGAKDTKALLKQDVRFLREAFAKYDLGRFDFEDGVIDRVVDNLSYKYRGSFPQKAIDGLDMIAAFELAKADKGDGYEEVKVRITPESVDRFFEEEEHLFKHFKLDESVFKFAQHVDTKLSDIGGATEAKGEMQKIVDFIKNPGEYLKKFPMMPAPKGILMEGPTGTGKTLLASAVAGEIDVPFSSMSAAELLKKYIGEGEEAVREWFQQLDQAATDSGKGIAVGFIDEIDAIGTMRSASDVSSETKTSILNQLLTLMDGFSNKNAKNKIILIAATNRADILDKALKRAGRFDRVVKVNVTETLKEVLEILNIHANRLPFENDAAKAEIFDEFGHLLKGMSGAEIKQIVDLTKEAVSEREGKQVITYDDMFEGFLRSIQGKKRVSEMSLLEKRQVAIHEAGHALMKLFFDLPLTALSNQERGMYGGVTVSPSFDKNPNFIDLIKDIVVKYAGGDAEALYSRHGHDAGVSQDLKQSTAFIQRAIEEWGLGVYTPRISLSNNEDMKKIYASEEKKDIDLITNLAKKTTKSALEFCKGFFDDVYLKHYDESIAAGNGGNVYSKTQLQSMFDKWLDETGKHSAYKTLKTDLIEKMYEAQKPVKDVQELAAGAAKKVSYFKPIALTAAATLALGGLIYAGMANSHKKTVKTVTI